MMYYRRKIILALMQLVGNTIDKITLQKLLLLFSKQQTNPVYDFVPYKFGCYSFTSNSDLSVMARKGILEESEKSFARIDTKNYVDQLKPEDRALLSDIVLRYGKKSSKELMYSTYVQYPYYARRSETAESLLSKDEYKIVRDSISKHDQTVLFTIGYEGISLEEYLNRLIKNDVKLLVDVRRNPLSMKFGFSKSQLQKYCSYLGIDYFHLPEVGISSEQRQELNTQNDYDRLFEFYRKENLPKTVSTQNKIVELLTQYKRIALTCFEANICQCHRKHLADAIVKHPEFKYELRHI